MLGPSRSTTYVHITRALPLRPWLGQPVNFRWGADDEVDGEKLGEKVSENKRNTGPGFHARDGCIFLAVPRQ
jgi:hypothetical protein